MFQPTPGFDPTVGGRSMERRGNSGAGRPRCRRGARGPGARVEVEHENDQTVGKISNLLENLIHENSKKNTAESIEIKLTMFTSERYEQSISGISKSIASPRN
jgi:hypothetical protein